MQRLKAASQQILNEVLHVAPRFAIAYPYLQQRGMWKNWFLFRGHDWNMPLCAAMPLTCRLLLPELPTKPGVPSATNYHEEVVIFRSEAGTYVSPHCGSSNMAINLHLTLTGARGTVLRVADESIRLEDGQAICFQDSFFHSIEHPSDAEAERISLVIRAMHPDLSLATYGGAARTDVVDLTKWDIAAELTRETERLRREYRRLAQEVHATAMADEWSVKSTSQDCSAGNAGSADCTQAETAAKQS